MLKAKNEGWYDTRWCDHKNVMEYNYIEDYSDQANKQAEVEEVGYEQELADTASLTAASSRMLASSIATTPPSERSTKKTEPSPTTNTWIGGTDRAKSPGDKHTAEFTITLDTGFGDAVARNRAMYNQHNAQGAQGLQQGPRII